MNTSRLKAATPVVSAAIAMVIAMAIGVDPASAQNAAQGVPNAMQGFSQNRDQPMQIDSGSLEIRDKDKSAVFSGKVRVRQGDTTMTANTLTAFYDQSPGQAKQPAMKSATAGPGGSQQIRRLEARGSVFVMQKDQTVTGDTGVFDAKSNSITLSGGVVLSQGENILSADRLVVDMTTGNSRLECDPGSHNSCRVRAIIKTDSKGAAGAGPAGILPGAAATPAVPGNRTTRPDAAKSGEPTRIAPR